MEAIDIGSRLELFLDEYLIDRMNEAELRMHQPTPRDAVLWFDRPWEGNNSGAISISQEEDLVRMWYRGLDADFSKKDYKNHPELICYAESTDGVHWERPSLGMVEFDGSKDNNIVIDGPGTHNLSPFRDGNPEAEDDARYKAVAVGNRTLFPYGSPDGIHWSPMSDKPIITDGYFDSHNLVFWDAYRGEYREYHRDFREDGESWQGNHTGRDIKTSTSTDFMSWPDPAWLKYSPGRVSELYTNNISPYYRAPHIFVGFPMRYVDRGWSESTKALPQLDHRRVRATWHDRIGTAVTDGMFISSRDGHSFNVWPESFIRPGLKLKDNWFYGDNSPAWGIVETDSPIEGGERELSIYATEGVVQPDIAERLRRYTLRIDGFVSVNAKLAGGELLTKPLVFAGSELVLNFSTSAAGSILVEVQNEGGYRIEGFGMDDCHEVWGDDLARTVKWGDTTDVSSLAGEPVRLRFRLRDADLYSMQFK